MFSLVAHEYAHAAAALRQGDDTAYMLGRVTLNPLPHIDLWMTLVFPALLWFGSGQRFTFGGAKPVPTNPRKYRHFKRGDIIVSAAGVVTNLALSLALAVLFVALHALEEWIPGSTEVVSTVQRMLALGIWVNLTLCFFNLIPIPPLDGSHLFYYLLPPRLGSQYRSLQRFGFLPLLLLLILFRPAVDFLLTPAFWSMGQLLRLIHPYGVGSAWDPFQ